MTKERIMLGQKSSSKAEPHVAASASHKLAVNVLATLNEDEGVEFYCIWQIDNGPWYSGPILLANRSGDYDVDFDLDDRTGLQLEFMPNADEAIWINSACCPFQGSGNDDKQQIRDKTVASRRQLKLKNDNSGEPCVLHYRLRFNGAAWNSANGNNYVAPYGIDPEFRNGGSN